MTGKRQRGLFDTYVTYYKWLTEATHYDDRISDLAEDARNDPEFPKKAKTFEVLYDYLSGTDAEETFLDSWKFYVMDREDMYMESMYAEAYE